MKTYKVKFINNIEYSVRFHKTGCVTIVDKDGEHEIGMWKKPANKDYMYRCKLFNDDLVEKAWEQGSLGERLACYWYRKKEKVH